MPGTILLIEDNEMTMELVTDLLEAAGFRLLVASDAERGVSFAIARRPDLILMDLALPGLDGLQATRRLKQDPATARIPVIALTAQVMAEDRRRARDAGCAGFIEKPIDTRSFARTVGEFLRAADGGRRGRAAGPPPGGGR
jgi:CheY-like chemotaxis protein